MFSKKTIKNFIVLEGIDGAGKSTAIDALYTVLGASGYTCKKNFEPTDSTTGTLIRSLLTDKKVSHSIHSSWFAYLFAANRYEHVYSTHGILDQIEQKNIVLCDRYLFSSIAYQGQTEDIKKLTRTLNSNFPLPGLLIYLDIPYKEALSRLKKNNKYDIVEKPSVLMEVQQRYEEILDEVERSTSVTIIKLNALLEQELLHREIQDKVINYLEN